MKNNEKHQENLKEFGAQLKKLRIERNLTQKKLAKGINVTLLTISKWENGKQSAKLDNIYKLVDFLKVTSDDLFGIILTPEMIDNTKRLMEKAKLNDK